VRVGAGFEVERISTMVRGLQAFKAASNPDMVPLRSGGSVVETAAIVLGLAAVGGITLAGIRLSGTPRPPTWMALGHGIVAAVGLGILIYQAATTSLPSLALVALGVFLLAAVGGATMFFGFHLKEKALPIPFVFGHGLAAVAAYVLLLVALFRTG